MQSLSHGLELGLRQIHSFDLNFKESRNHLSYSGLTIQVLPSLLRVVEPIQITLIVTVC